MAKLQGNEGDGSCHMTEQAVWRVVSRTILLVFVIIGSALLLRELRDVVVQLLLAILLAAAATPVVDRATASRWPWRLSRGVAAIVVFVAALAFLLLGWVVILGTVSHDLIGRSEERRVGKECRSRWS